MLEEGKMKHLGLKHKGEFFYDTSAEIKKDGLYTHFFRATERFVNVLKSRMNVESVIIPEMLKPSYRKSEFVVQDRGIHGENLWHLMRTVDNGPRKYIYKRFL